MSRPGSERHTRPSPERRACKVKVGWKSQDESHQSQVRLHHTHQHPRALAAASARSEQQGRAAVPPGAGRSWPPGGAGQGGRAGWQGRARQVMPGMNPPAYRMQEGRGWMMAFRWLRCYPRRKWNGPAPKNEVPGDWPPSFLALPGPSRGRLPPASEPALDALEACPGLRLESERANYTNTACTHHPARPSPACQVAADSKVQ